MDEKLSDAPTGNLARWRNYLANITSPDLFINISFYYLISASLQRRVYVGSDEMPLFGNQYVILVGAPGIGKGLVIKPTTELLKYHKLRKAKGPAAKAEKDKPMTAEDIAEQLEILRGLQSQLDGDGATLLPDNFNQSPNKGGPQQQARQLLEEPLLIPIAADATTYEALVRNHSRSFRSICSKSTSRLIKSGVYSHSSICFCLEEISSLFRKHTEDVVNYLLKAYDCGDYIYETKNQGIDRVKSMCLNFLGGTTPAFMKSSFNDKILNEGFSSRSLFVYAASNRFERFQIASFSDEQLADKAHILEHIEKLTRLFGQVDYTPEANAFLKHYIEKELPIERSRASEKLLYYFSRKNAHIQKLAMAIHFSDSTEMTIDLRPCQMAAALLTKIEANMEEALNVGGRNPLSTISSKIYRYIKTGGPAAFSQIWAQFYDEVNENELTEIITFLRTTGKIDVTTVKKQPGNVEITKFYAKV